MLHKSDAGGVVVGIADAEALARALADMQQRLAPAGVLGRADGAAGATGSS